MILAGSVHLYYHPEWPDIKLAQAALLCGQAADMITAEGLQVGDVPVVLGGDWNSLWRKYRPDVYDAQVSPSALGGCAPPCALFAHMQPAVAASPRTVVRAMYML